MGVPGVIQACNNTVAVQMRGGPAGSNFYALPVWPRISEGLASKTVDTPYIRSYV